MRRDELRAMAKEFRSNPTRAEREAWEILRAKRCLGLKFKRQFPLRGFIVDFFCRELRLILEIDGSVHDEPDQRERDLAKDELFRACGFRVVRIRNEDVGREALESLLRSLKDVPPPLV
jgi:uroporphyrinogen-III synthase